MFFFFWGGGDVVVPFASKEPWFCELSGDFGMVFYWIWPPFKEVKKSKCMYKCKVNVAKQEVFSSPGDLLHQKVSKIKQL